ncbi:RIP metalloprotease RseP [Salinisphaera sp. USBA-960]|nr:RIP metalloprotease RseP [Salifodinibacter halophilus]NNC26211.1 RIP metalloprotease RseP [Salifodinibacter halophilus]
MIQVIIAVAAFLVAIGILVAVHEWGHYIVARLLGVGVVRYSIGFGKRLAGFTSKRTGTEYQIAALPLGGYVKLLDENDAPVADKDKPRAMNRAHPLRRIAIVAAGPGINFLFAIAAYWLVLIIGVGGIQPIVGAPSPNSLAAEANIQAHDRVVAVDGQSVDSWRGLKLKLIDHALDNDNSAVLTLQREGQTRHSTTLNLAHVPDDPEQLFDKLGLAPYQPPATPIVDHVVDGSPAAAGGLQSGDRIKALAGQAVDSPKALVQAIRARPGQTVAVKFERSNRTLMRDIKLGRQTAEQGGSSDVGHLGVAIGVDASALETMQTTRRMSPIAAVPAAVDKTWRLSALTVRMFGHMFTGQVSWDNIGGPIQIADYAGKTASVGFVAFVDFLALISLSLAVINLLPIPVLDGGHILYYLAEWIIGRPLGEATQALVQRVGVGALMALMVLAFYNDITRLLG